MAQTRSTLLVRTDVQVQARDGEPVVVWVGRAGSLIDGMPVALMRALLPLLDGTRDIDAVAQALAPRWPAETARAAVDALRTLGCLAASATDDGDDHIAADDDAARGAEHDGPAGAHVLVLGDAQLAEVCAAAISARGVRVERDVAQAAGATLAVVALEGEPLRAQLDIAAAVAPTPCCFVTALGAGEITVGPTAAPALGPCSVCAQLELRGVPYGEAGALLDEVRALSLDDDPAVSETLLTTVARHAADEAVSASPPSSSYTLAARALLLDARGNSLTARLLPRGDCPRCGSASDAPATSADAASTPDAAQLDIARSACIAIGEVWPETPQQPLAASEHAYRRVGIIGGGTAGYLTALALRRTHPHLEVTLIESSKIPVIGVGEATTPEMVKFLHAPRFLGRSVADFYRRVQPTWKLGIQFAWGAPAPYSFPFPFQRGRLLESMLYEGNLDAQSLGALLMANDRAPVFAARDGELRSLIHSVRWAYHLDNRRFVAYLADEARTAGVRHIDARVSDVVLDAQGDNIDELVLDDGAQRVSFDLYVDCSGFRSLLLGSALDTPYSDYGATLMTDRAVVANVPNGGMIRPYTLAETYDNGWCWRIPFHHDDHRGYVFSSAHCSDEQAVDEMRAKNPEMSDPRILRFSSGRRRDAWRGNVVAIGNAYGFVEPLESTALHMIVLSIEMLTTNLPASTRDEAIKRTLNRKIGDQWDALRWFLGIHYRFNRRLDTPFWRAANAEVDISGAEERVALFRERAPLSYRSSLFYKLWPPDFFTDDHSFDTLMVGQKVEAHTVEPVEDRQSWNAKLAVLRAMADRALPQARALAWLADERPELLDDFQQRPDSWLHTWLPA